jgi:GLPGLI family protein
MSSLSFAQKIEGMISYELKANLHKRLPKDQEGMKSMIPEFRTHQFELFFNQFESFYRNVEEEEDDDEGDNGGVQIKMKFPQTLSYQNYKNKTKAETREFFGKTFLIDDSLKAPAWKLSDESKTIQGYVCKKATYTNVERKQNVIAWYAERLMASAGPESYHSLPGLVLEVDINEGETIIIAKKIDLRELKKGEIKIPTEGKKITNAEYKKMVDEKMKEMGGGGIRIMRN